MTAPQGPPGGAEEPAPEPRARPRARRAPASQANPPERPLAGLGRRAAGNTVLVLGGRIVSRAVALVAVIVMSRRLGSDGFGQLQTVVIYSAVVGAVSDLGCQTLFVRESARRTDLLERYLANVLSVRLVLSLGALGILAAVLLIPGLESLLLPGFALLTLSAYSNLLRGAFYATQRLGFEAADIILESAVLLGLALLGAALHGGVAYYLWAYAASYAAACAFFATALWRTGLARPSWRLDRELFGPWLRAGAPLALTYVMATLYFKIDVPILQRSRPFDEVGWYTLAYKPFESLLFLPVTIRTVLFPVMAVYFRASARRLSLAVEKLFKALLLCGLPLSVLCVLLAPQLTRLLHLYPESEPALRILGLGIVFVFVNNTAVAALNAMDRQNVFALLAVSDLCVNLVLNLALIPRFGYLAAAATTVATEAVSAVVSWVLLARYGQRLALGRVGWPILAAGALMSAVMLPLRDVGELAGVGVALLGLGAYGAGLLLFRAVDAEERAVVGSVLRGQLRPERIDADL